MSKKNVAKIISKKCWELPFAGARSQEMFSRVGETGQVTMYSETTVHMGNSIVEEEDNYMMHIDRKAI